MTVATLDYPQDPAPEPLPIEEQIRRLDDDYEDISEEALEDLQLMLRDRRTC